MHSYRIKSYICHICLQWRPHIRQQQPRRSWRVINKMIWTKTINNIPFWKLENTNEVKKNLIFKEYDFCFHWKFFSSNVPVVEIDKGVPPIDPMAPVGSITTTTTRPIGIWDWNWDLTTTSKRVCCVWPWNLASSSLSGNNCAYCTCWITRFLSLFYFPHRSKNKSTENNHNNHKARQSYNWLWLWLRPFRRRKNKRTENNHNNQKSRQSYNWLWLWIRPFSRRTNKSTKNNHNNQKARQSYNWLRRFSRRKEKSHCDDQSHIHNW